MTELEIHHINVGQGDSTLIINRDIAKLGANITTAINAALIPGPLPANAADYLPYAIQSNLDAGKVVVKLEGTVRYALLIDAGEFVYGDDVFYYMTSQGVSGAATQANFYTLATHFHSDHVYGFRDIYFKDFDDKKDVSLQTIKYQPSIAYDCGKLAKWDKALTYTIYQAYIKKLMSNNKTQQIELKPHRTIQLGEDSNNKPIVLTCMASNGIVSVNGHNLSKKKIVDKNSPDQNARSVVLILEYGDFRYFLGGDIGGTGDEKSGNWGANKDTRDKKAYSTHPDIETGVTAVLPIKYTKDANRAKTVDGHMCCFFANHHGSASSNDIFLIEQVKPKLMVCSAGVRTRFHFHPTQQLFQRFDPGDNFSKNWQTPGKTNAEDATVPNTIDGYYMTEVAKDGRYGKGKSGAQFTRTFDAGKILGDVIVRPLSGITPLPNQNNEIKIQVYGTGDLTAASVQSKELRDVYNDPNPPYPIGPFIHTCDLH